MVNEMVMNGHGNSDNLDLRQEPGAVVPHAGICAGPG
jgi:hypothetical protein